MKIFKKSINDGDVYIAKIYLRDIPVGNDLLFQTIDFKESLEIIDGPDEDEFREIALRNLGFNEMLYIISYDTNVVVIASAPHFSYKCQNSIQIDAFCMWLRRIYDKMDCSTLEDYFEPFNNPDASHDNSESNLPMLSDYITQHADAFKTIYYPGAGYDFSSFYVFSHYSNIQSVYFVDYMNVEEYLPIRSVMDNRADQLAVLSPPDFNKTKWSEFWPKELEHMDWVFGADNNSESAWGRKVTFKHPKKTEQNVDFYYLGTEGVKTAEILLENKIFPNVVVLQDHGFGGNWTSFGGADSPLYKVMSNHLPEYLLAETPETGGNTEIWPGYVKVARSNPPSASPQLFNQRTLFKRAS
jgi:hypothetical protein